MAKRRRPPSTPNPLQHVRQQFNEAAHTLWADLPKPDREVSRVLVSRADAAIGNVIDHLKSIDSAAAPAGESADSGGET